MFSPVFVGTFRFKGEKRDFSVKKFHWFCLACCALALACGDDAAPANPGGGVGQGGQGGSPVVMGREVCDGEDNDSDGSVDEGLTTRACSNACGTGQGMQPGRMARLQCTRCF